jgi:hypothetical protein
MPYSPEKTLALIHDARQKVFPPNPGAIHEGMSEFIHSDKQVTAYLMMEVGIPGVIRHFFRQKLREYINGEFLNIETPDQIYPD